MQVEAIPKVCNAAAQEVADTLPLDSCYQDFAALGHLFLREYLLLSIIFEL